jgi:hypothetical protein
MIKQTWNVSREEKNRILNLHETATKNLYIKSPVNEQKNVGIVVGKTDASKVSHAALSKFGLPSGAEHENYYYYTDVSKIFDMAKSDDKSKYLSIFQPSNAYDENKKAYMDYVQFGDDDTNSLSDSGSKVFKVSGGNVFATHNGLLALMRVIEGLHTNQIFYTVPIKIQFGEHTGKEAEEKSERGFDAIKLNVEAIENHSSSVRGIQSHTSLLPVKDYKNTTLYPTFNLPKENVISIVKNMLLNRIIGVGTFLPEDKKDDVLKNLTPKGYITTIKTDIDTAFSKLIQLASLEDFTYPGGYRDENKGTVNPDKLNKVSEIGKSYQDALFKEYRESYINNLKLFVDNYVPNNTELINQLVSKIYVPIIPLGVEFERLFNAKFGGGYQTKQPEYKTDTKKSDVGN